MRNVLSRNAKRGNSCEKSSYNLRANSRKNESIGNTDDKT